MEKMVNDKINTGEILFIKSVKDGIPNRDPLNDSDARRLFGEDDGRISLSDVSIKRDVRDYISMKYRDGGDDKKYFIWCREERDEDNTLLGRERLADTIIQKSKNTIEKNEIKILLQAAYDIRVFGAVFSVKNKSFHKTGPTQFGWAHSLHPVKTKYVQGTTVMPTKDVRVIEQEIDEKNLEEMKSISQDELLHSEIDKKPSDKGKMQGAPWTMYYLPFAVFAMPGVVNANIASETGMNEDDVELLLEGLWKGTLNRQARGRGLQQPLLLVYVEYNDPLFRIGYLEDRLYLEPDREAWLSGNPPTDIKGITLDVSQLSQVLSKENGSYISKIDRVRWWKNPEFKLKGNLPGDEMQIW